MAGGLCAPKEQTRSIQAVMQIDITYIVRQLQPAHVCYVLPQCQTTVHLDTQRKPVKH